MINSHTKPTYEKQPPFLDIHKIMTKSEMKTQQLTHKIRQELPKSLILRNAYSTHKNKRTRNSDDDLKSKNPIEAHYCILSSVGRV